MAKEIERITIQPRDWMALSHSGTPISGYKGYKKKRKNVKLRDDGADNPKKNVNGAKIDGHLYVFTRASSLYINTRTPEGLECESRASESREWEDREREDREWEDREWEDRECESREWEDRASESRASESRASESRECESVDILKELDKHKCLLELNIYKIPCEIGNCDLWSKLNTVRLVDTGLCSVPSTILQSRSLHCIDFSGSDFSKLAQLDFSGVPNLRVLIMCRSRLRVIPNVSNNTHLQVLDLSINLITNPWAGWGAQGKRLFPEELMTLSLNDNHLTDFPEFPSTLKYVFLSNNFAVHDKK
jgi:hypothetical protein